MSVDNQNKSVFLRIRINNLIEEQEILTATFLPLDEFKSWDKAERMKKLLFRAIEAGWEEFNWKEAHKLGWFCPHDYGVFEELKDFNWREWLKDSTKGN